MKKNYLLIALIAIVLLGAVGYGIYTYMGNRAISFVTISINPDVELALNSNDLVVDVIPINEEADIITSDLDLIGDTVEEASEKIVDAAVETGYIDEYSEDNTVVVTTVNDDEDVRKLLEEKVMNCLNAHFESRKIYPVLVAQGLSDELKAEADSYNISYGKMLLIERAVLLNEDLDKDSLVDMSVRDIQKEIQEYVLDRHDALKESIDKLKLGWQEDKLQLKQEYTSKVNQLKANISEEQKGSLQNMTPTEQEQAIKGILDNMKEEIKVARDSVKEELKTDTSNNNYPILEDRVDQIKEEVKNKINNRLNR